MKSPLIQRLQAGDTIVEVLISIAIVSLTLAGAFASANRNTNTMQDTQEHSQALQLVKSQIELLRSRGITTVPGCFDDTGTAEADSGDNCYFHADGSSTTSSDPLAYHVTISGPVNGIYSVKAEWQSLIGGMATVNLFYGPPAGA